MHRREFLVRTAAGMVLVAAPAHRAPAGQVAPPAPPLVPPDKGIDAETLGALRRRGERRVFRGRYRRAIGMPVGGLGAGQVSIRADGRLADWRIDGRRTPRAEAPPRRDLEQGYAIVSADDFGQSATAVLADLDAGGSYDDIDFVGEYPVAEIRYVAERARAAELPRITVALTALTPFMPLRARESAYPGVLLRWRLTNNGIGRQRGHVLAWLQHGLARGAPLPPGAARRTTVLREAGLTGAVMDVQDAAGARLREHGTMVLAAAADAAVRTALARSRLTAPPEPADQGADEPPALHAGAEEDAPIARLAIPFDLAAEASRDILLVAAWHHPGTEGDAPMYQEWFEDALGVAAELCARAPELAAGTEQFRRTWYEDSTLPSWLMSRLMMPVASLASTTVRWTRGHGLRWAADAGDPGTIARGADAPSAFFPAFGAQLPGPPAHAETVLLALRAARTTADPGAIARLHAAAAPSLDALVRAAPDAARSAADAGLELAALLAGETLARMTGDDAAGTRCSAASRARRASWDLAARAGGSFTDVPALAGAAPCRADQLLGQLWARDLDLPPLADEQRIADALRSVFRENFAPSLAPIAAAFPGRTLFAGPQDAGLLPWTWPGGRVPPDAPAESFQVRSGLEYQVAALLAWEGLVDEALVLLRAIDERFDGARRNPWNEADATDHPAPALSSTMVLRALAGFTLDAPAGVLTVAPRLSPGHFAAPFVGPEWWGRLLQGRGPGDQLNEVELRAGTLRIAELRTVLPDDAAQRLGPAPGPRTRARLDGADVPCTGAWRAPGSGVAARFASPVELREGQTLRVFFDW